MLTQQQDQAIRNFSKSEREYNDNVSCFLTFGHLFNHNPMACLSQTYCIQGKPALNADSMAGIVRAWIDPTSGKKVCALLKATVLEPSKDENGNIDPSTFGVSYTAMRSDELAFAKEYGLDPTVHTWTFTMEHAIKRGVQNKRVWREMPLVMCGKRALTAICRLVFPDIIGTANSPDELAEMILDDEDEITRISLAANGEQIPYDLKKNSSVKPQPIASTAPQAEEQPKRFHLRDFTSIQTVCAELTDEKIDLDDCLQALEFQSDVSPSQMNEGHFRQFFYPVMFSPLRIFLTDQKLHELDLKEHDTDAMAAMFDGWYGTHYEKERDGDLEGYCANVIKWSHSPVFSELARYTQKLVCKDLLDEETREKILYTITQNQNLFDFDLYDNILKTLPLIS